MGDEVIDGGGFAAGHCLRHHFHRLGLGLGLGSSSSSSSSAAAAAAGSSGCSWAAPLLLLEAKLSPSKQHVHLQAQPLKLTLKPRCLAALAALVGLLPTDTLDAQLTRGVAALHDRGAQAAAKAALLGPDRPLLTVSASLSELRLHVPGPSGPQQLGCATLCIRGLRPTPSQQAVAPLRLLDGGGSAAATPGGGTASIPVPMPGAAPAPLRSKPGSAGGAEPAQPDSQQQAEALCLLQKRQYQHLRLELASMEVLLQAPGGSQPVQLLGQLHLAADISISRLPQDLTSPAVRTRIKLSTIQGAISSTQLRHLQQLVASLGPTKPERGASAASGSAAPSDAQQEGAADADDGEQLPQPTSPTSSEVCRWLSQLPTQPAGDTPGGSGHGQAAGGSSPPGASRQAAAGSTAMDAELQQELMTSAEMMMIDLLLRWRTC